MWDKRQNADSLLLRYQIGIPPADHERLLALPKDRQAEFVWDLWSALLTTGVEFGIAEPLPKEILLTVAVHYDAPLAKDLFMERFARLNTASNFAMLVFRKAFRKLLAPFDQGIAN